MTEVKKEKKINYDEKFDNKTMDDLFPGMTSTFVSRRHDEPCPKQTTADIKDCVDTNEWVLNHLPLTEEQKKKLIQDLVNDNLKKESAEKNKKKLVAQRKDAKKWKLVQKRQNVKSLTKQS